MVLGGCEGDEELSAGAGEAEVARVDGDEADVDRAPLPSLGLVVAGGEGAEGAGVGDALAADGEEEGLDADGAARGVEAAEEHVPVFRDDGGVPVARLAREVERDGVHRERESVVEGVCELAEEADAEEGVADRAEDRDLVAVRVEVGRGLPEAARPGRFGLGDVGSRERREVRGVEVRVGVADGDDDARLVDALDLDELSTRASHGPVLVRALAADLAGAQLVQGRVHPSEFRRELGLQRARRRPRARVARLHGQDHHQGARRIALRGERRQRPPQRPDRLLVVRDRHDVDHVVVPELRRRFQRGALRVASPPVDLHLVVSSQLPQAPERGRARHQVLGERVQEPGLDHQLQRDLPPLRRPLGRRVQHDAQPRHRMQQWQPCEDFHRDRRASRRRRRPPRVGFG
mmetsp:Transcript_21428/g.67274  ORF Transcript_21428/g.67274 Transcript_21428/m.67274 type:complete len:405 (-) Transcript_21428:66-1280(-)